MSPAAARLLASQELGTDDVVYGVAAAPGAFLLRTGHELLRLSALAGRPLAESRRRAAGCALLNRPSSIADDGPPPACLGLYWRRRGSRPRDRVEKERLSYRTPKRLYHGGAGARAPARQSLPLGPEPPPWPQLLRAKRSSVSAS